jgi:hypothetical protein
MTLRPPSQNRRRDLVSDAGHWELRSEDCEQQLASFKQALKLKSLYWHDEADDVGDPASPSSPAATN